MLMYETQDAGLVKGKEDRTSRVSQSENYPVAIRHREIKEPGGIAQHMLGLLCCVFVHLCAVVSVFFMERPDYIPA